MRWSFLAVAGPCGGGGSNSAHPSSRGRVDGGEPVQADAGVEAGTHGSGVDGGGGEPAARKHVVVDVRLRSSRRGQYAKAFWDLDDTRGGPTEGTSGSDCNGGGPDSDVSNLATTSIFGGWDGFPDGTANHQARESSVHGVNAADYDANFPVDDTTLLHHSCLTDQL